MTNEQRSSVGPIRDVVENFHGNQVVYIDWDYHRLISAGMAFPLPPDMPFGALIEEIIPSIWSKHPDFEKIDWKETKWVLDDEEFKPDFGRSLVENGVGHKSLIQFSTPNLMGVGGTGN